MSNPIDNRAPYPQPTVITTAEHPPPAESEARGEYVRGELAGEEVYVPPVKKWRSSALSALRAGDMHGWAESTLDDDGWAVWLRVDPSLEEIEDFFGSINAGLGTNPGNSRASRRSSRPMGRR